MYRGEISLGGTIRTTLPKSKKVGLNFFKKKSSIYTLVYLIGLGGLCFFPSMHTFMKNNEHPKTYNMH
jgi:hypothetical protein